MHLGGWSEAGGTIMRVLVIDDEVSLLRVIQRRLGKKYEVVTAMSASEAFVCLAVATFEVILCDRTSLTWRGRDFSFDFPRATRPAWSA